MPSQAGCANPATVLVLLRNDGERPTARKTYHRANRERCSATNGKAHLCPDREGGGLYFGAVKSKAGRRMNAIPEQLVGPLRMLWDQHVAAGRPTYTDPAGVEVELLFRQAHGAPWRAELDLKRWHAFLARAGVSAVGFTTSGTPRRRCCC